MMTLTLTVCYWRREIIIINVLTGSCSSSLIHAFMRSCAIIHAIIYPSLGRLLIEPVDYEQRPFEESPRHRQWWMRPRQARLPLRARSEWCLH